jgi:prepilin-type N-terminal cleavage/methylation domain-containing protein
MNKVRHCGLRISDFGIGALFLLPYNPQSAIRNPKSKGFTLLEVLLAMSILAVIMTVIYTSFSTAGQNVERAEVLRDETDLARTLIARLSHDIENADCDHVTYGAVFYGKKEEIETEGGKRRHDSLALTTLTNFPRPDSKETELLEADYYFKEKADGKGYSLMRREKRELTKDTKPLEGGVEYEITDQVAELRFRYSSTGLTWDDVWVKTQCIRPAIVEMTLVLTSGKQYSTVVRAKDSI